MATKQTAKAATHVPRAKNVARARAPIAKTALARPTSAVVLAAAGATQREARAAEKLVAQVRALREQRMRVTFEMGVLLEKLSQPTMYGALGYDSFEALVVDRDLSHPLTALQLVRVARELDEPTVHELGFDKAYAFIRYLEAKYPRAKPREVAAKNPVISGLGMRLRDVSTKQLRAAHRALVPPKRSPANTPPPEVVEAAARLRAALREAGLGRIPVTTVRVSGRWIVRAELSAKQATVVAERME
jgi:hypothetical protein